MNNRSHIRTPCINRTMKREFRGRLVQSGHGAIRRNMHNIVRGEFAFIDSAGRNPDAAVIIANG
jgi:hypothetical protein